MWSKSKSVFRPQFLGPRRQNLQSKKLKTDSYLEKKKTILKNDRKVSNSISRTARWNPQQNLLFGKKTSLEHDCNQNPITPTIKTTYIFGGKNKF